LVIRIFGTGCVSCNRLYTMLIELLDRLEIAADVEQIYDPDEIGRHGVTKTPALMINGAIKCAGLLPSPAQAELWLREQL
jgi:predicted thioredoxin/glutaredoxin